MDWKELGCTSFSKFLNKDQKSCFKESTALPLDSMQTRINRNNQLKLWLMTDRQNDLFEMLNESYLMIPEFKSEAGINYYFSKIVEAIGTGNQEEIDKFNNETKKNKVYNWRALRLLYRDMVSIMQNGNKDDKKEEND